MPIDEKRAFTKRLKLALKRSNKKISTPAKLRHPKESITAQAAQKWLTGKARPTADKIATLADSLTVSAHWLSFGAANGKQIITTMRHNKTHMNMNASLSDTEIYLVTQLRHISEHP